MKEVLKNAEERMEKSAANLEHTYAGVRVGRANPAVLDKVKVDYYGAPTAINQLAAVSVAEARVLVIQPWDASVCRAIEKAIQASDIGINPQSDGKVIRIPAVDRGAPQGACQRGQQDGGGDEDHGAFHPPRRH